MRALGCVKEELGGVRDGASETKLASFKFLIRK
jgi:hypothetical protein